MAENDKEKKKTSGTKAQGTAANAQPQASYDLDTFIELAMTRSYEDID